MSNYYSDLVECQNCGEEDFSANMSGGYCMDCVDFCFVDSDDEGDGSGCEAEDEQEDGDEDE